MAKMDPNAPETPILRYFRSGHLTDERLAYVSQKFEALAREMDDLIPGSAEKSAGLRKLLEAKDCMVRAALDKEN